MGLGAGVTVLCVLCSDAAGSAQQRAMNNTCVSARWDLIAIARASRYHIIDAHPLGHSQPLRVSSLPCAANSGNASVYKAALLSR
jgi:hypothetical protein